MDIDIDMSCLMMAEEEEDDEDEELTMTQIVACALLIHHGITKDRSLRAQKRHRHYLTRPDLLPNPRGSTPWQQLYEGRNDMAFITTMGFNVETFFLILDGGFEAAWCSKNIPRKDVPSNSTPRVHRRSLDPAGALGLALHFLSSTMLETSLAQIFALVPATVNRYLNFSLSILLSVLRFLPDSQVRWPVGDAFQALTALVTARHPLLTGAFGTMDGLNLPVQTSGDADVENMTYNGWLHSHFVSNVFAYAASGTHHLLILHNKLTLTR
jgi:hypothetical protein